MQSPRSTTKPQLKWFSVIWLVAHNICLNFHCIDKSKYVFQIDIGTVPIPKSVTPKRIEENIDVFDFKLIDDEIKYIDTFNTGERVISFLESRTDKYFPFAIEF